MSGKQILDFSISQIESARVLRTDQRKFDSVALTLPGFRDLRLNGAGEKLLQAHASQGSGRLHFAEQLVGEIYRCSHIYILA